MPARPIFLVDSIKNVKRKAQADFYTGDSEKADLWKVSFVHGYFAGIGMAFFFPDEASADEFSIWQIYGAAEILKLIPPTEQFVAQSIEKKTRYDKKNQYTDQKERVLSWEANLADPILQRQIALRYPNERMARQWAISRSYTMQDILGTLPAMPADIAQQLAQSAAQSAAAAQANAAAAAASGSAQTQTAEAVAEAASWQPTGWVVEPGKEQWWYGTNGGATGYYDDVFYQGGTFNEFSDVGPPGTSAAQIGALGSTPYNGAWFGRFGRTIGEYVIGSAYFED